MPARGRSAFGGNAAPTKCPMNGATTGARSTNKHLENQIAVLYIESDRRTHYRRKGVIVGKSVGTLEREIHSL